MKPQGGWDADVASHLTSPPRSLTRLALPIKGREAFCVRALVPLDLTRGGVQRGGDAGDVDVREFAAFQL